MKRIHDKPMTSAERQARRLERLNRIARANGYKSWRYLETTLINISVESVTMLIPKK